MKITNGKIIIAIGIIHTTLTPLVYIKQFQGFAHHLFFSINGGFMEKQLNYQTFAAFWCLYFGLILFPLGVLLDAIERKKMRIPLSFILTYFAIVLIGVYMIPWSGMTIFALPHTIYMLIKTKKNKISPTVSSNENI
jgi:hypothetical protein